MKAVSKSDIKMRADRRGTIRQFIESGKTEERMTVQAHEKPITVYTSFATAIKRDQSFDELVRVTRVFDEIYLVRRDEARAPTKHRKTGKCVDTVREFLASGEEACLVPLENGDKPKSVAASYRNAIARESAFRGRCRCVRRGDNLFLIREV